MGNIRIHVTFTREWVLTRRGDARLPIDTAKEWIAQEVPGRQTVEFAGLTELRVLAEEPECGRILLHESLGRFLREQYGEGISRSAIYIDLVPGAQVGTPPAPAAGKMDAGKGERGSAEGTVAASKTGVPGFDRGSAAGKAPDAKADAPAKEVDAGAAISALLGAEDFKQLAVELSMVAPPLVRDGQQALLTHRRYLFAIGGGCGLTTALRLLQRHLAELSLFPFEGSEEPLELRLDPPGNDPAGVLDQTAGLLGGHGGGRRLVCLDLEEWMDRLNGPDFRRFLRRLARLEDRHLLVFRIPFVDQDTVASIEALIADHHTVRSLAFPPLPPEALRAYAGACAARSGFELAPDALRLFERRMAVEKSDGRFDGLNTVAKVVREMLLRYYEHRACMPEGVPVSVSAAHLPLGADDLAGLVQDGGDETGDAMTRLDAMIGLETVKARIREIIEQIVYAAAHPQMERPCLHMRFVGNPGTGKTTVARLLGQLLAERGVLRNGLFFEHAGRDFCGRYIGETAPKTAGIVRDAYGSVLFIDEAYSLYRGEDDTRDYGREALDTLIAEMENHRTDLMVIMAGYPDEMETLMAGNSGLAGRMPYLVEFPNYDRPALLAIFRSMYSNRYAVADGFEEAAAEWFAALPDSVLSSRTFSNARFVRNLFERTWGKAVLRARLNNQAPLTLTRGDFLEASSEREFSGLNAPRHKRLGF